MEKCLILLSWNQDQSERIAFCYFVYDSSHINKMLQVDEIGVVTISHFSPNSSQEIFSLFIYKHINKEDKNITTAIFYIATATEYQGLKLSSLLICQLEKVLYQFNQSINLFLAAPVDQGKFHRSNGLKKIKFNFSS